MSTSPMYKCSCGSEANGTLNHEFADRLSVDCRSVAIFLDDDGYPEFVALTGDDGIQSKAFPVGDIPPFPDSRYETC